MQSRYSLHHEVVPGKQPVAIHLARCGVTAAYSLHEVGTWLASTTVELAELPSRPDLSGRLVFPVVVLGIMAFEVAGERME
jgi:hypothetical protein